MPKKMFATYPRRELCEKRIKVIAFRFSRTLPGVAQASLQLFAFHGSVKLPGRCRNPSFTQLALIRSTHLQPARKFHAQTLPSERISILVCKIVGWVAECPYPTSCGLCQSRVGFFRGNHKAHGIETGCHGQNNERTAQSDNNKCGSR